MKKLKTLKIGICALIFTAASIGFSITIKTKKIAGERISVSMLTLGSVAEAYCNEGGSTGNDGKCSGTADQAPSRCFTAIDQNNLNCSGATVMQ